MDKKKTEEKMLKLCAQLVSETKKFAEVKKSGTLKKPCGLVLFIFCEKGTATISTGKIDPLGIVTFLAYNFGVTVAEPIVPPSSPQKLKQNNNN